MSTQIQHSTRPGYYSADYYIPELGNRIDGMIAVYELRECESRFMFKIFKTGDWLHELLKRGIPMEDAKTIFYGNA